MQTAAPARPAPASLVPPLPGAAQPQPACTSHHDPAITAAHACWERLPATRSYFPSHWEQKNQKWPARKAFAFYPALADQHHLLWMVWVWSPGQKVQCHPLACFLISAQFPVGLCFICTVNPAGVAGSTGRKDSGHCPEGSICFCTGPFRAALVTHSERQWKSATWH